MTQRFTVPYAVSGAYEELINGFIESGAQDNCITIGTGESIPLSFGACETQDEAVFGLQLYLKQWSWRSGSKKTKKVDVILHAQEQINYRQRILRKSRVRLNYFSIEDTTAHLLQSLRYDFDQTPHNGQHPLFHAQTADEVIEGIGPIAEEFTFQVNGQRCGCFPNVRIPTADMTLSSVLLGLAADHWQEPFFSEFRENCRTLQTRLPQPDLTFLRDSLALQNNIAHVKSLHWYRC